VGSGSGSAILPCAIHHGTNKNILDGSFQALKNKHRAKPVEKIVDSI